MVSLCRRGVDQCDVVVVVVVVVVDDDDDLEILKNYRGRVIGRG
jgi:hypothetical protein